MKLNLYLFRHGETAYNVNPEFIGGSNNLELSERGERQAEALGKRLKKEGIVFDEIYFSTAIRTCQTMEIVCSVLNYRGEKNGSKDLWEQSQGDWNGKRRVEVYTPEVLKEMKEKHSDFKPPNGESLYEAGERGYSFIERNLLCREKDLTVGIFGHGMTTKGTIANVLESDPRMTYRISIDNCSITQLKYSSEEPHQGWSLVKLNDNSHLYEVGFVPNVWF